MFTINLNTQSKVPIYEQIYEFIKSEIINGSLGQNAKLPSTRNLASFLQVSRNTIDMAYGQLLSEGYIESIEKKGYYVCQIANIIHSSSKDTPQSNTNKQNNDLVSLQKSPTNEVINNIDYKYNFTPFSIDLSSFPYNTWRRLSKNCLQDNNKDLFLLGQNQGDDNLRSAITTYIHQSRGVNCSKDQIIVGAGVDYLLQLFVQLIEKESTIAMENPTYKRAYNIFNGLNFHTVPIALDQNGMNISELNKTNAKIAYVTPSHQYPLGIVMPIKRRLELLDWANVNKNRYIIEDDHDSEFRYKGKPIPSLQGMDTNDKVIYIGTFSRAIAPAIRIGYMVLPKNLLAIYKKDFHYYSCTVSRVDQSIMTHFIEEGFFERHLNKMRKVYKSKHDTLVNALKIFGNKIHVDGEHAGLHLVIHFKLNITEDALIELASKSKIKLYGLNEHYIGENHTNTPTILLGYANLTEKEIEDGITLLHQLMVKHLNIKK